MKTSVIFLTDFYKLSHPNQYPPGTEYVYSNTTPRGSRIDGVDEVVVFGVQYLVKEYFINQFNEFFSKPKSEAIGEFRRIIDASLGKDSVDYSKFEALHDLGYLPLTIKCLPEGVKCPLRVPFMTIVNTLPEFYWLTNFVESLTQTVIWQAVTSATIANRFKSVLNYYTELTGSHPGFVQFQGHDFSMRGMSSVETGSVSAAAHLLSFVGTDTVSAIPFLEEYYNADCEKELIGCSVPATEHAVMCAGGEEDEMETFRRLLEDVYPTGILSVVSDTWDFWGVLHNILPQLKSKILSREGKLVIRPDSGDPVRITAGYIVKEVSYDHDALKRKMSSMNHNPFTEGFDCVKTSDGVFVTSSGSVIQEHEAKGAVQVLWDLFGGSVNVKGYKELDPHIGLIYGDGITVERADRILHILSTKGFASGNVVFGVGSFTYQYNTRDTFSIACKATWVQIFGVAKPIFKDPKTDNGTKKSAKGLLKVEKVKGKYVLKDDVTPEEESEGELVKIFENGNLLVDWSLEQIRKNLA